MIKKVASGVLFSMLLVGTVLVTGIPTKAQVATPSQAVITVSGIPTGTKFLVVEVTVDSTVITLGGVTSDSGGAAFSDSRSVAVGVFSDSDLPATLALTVGLNGVAVGTSSFTVGMVLDKFGTGGVAITGASAMSNVSSVMVASSTSSSSSSSSTTGGTTGTGSLSANTITVMLNGQNLNSAEGVNVTLSFGTEGVATLDTTGLTFMGTGTTPIATEVKGTLISAIWSGSITDAEATFTAMLKPGTMTGSTTISVSKVELSGGTDVTSNIVATVTPSSVTNSGSTTMAGTFSLIGPTSVVGPGKAAIAFSASGVTSTMSATLNDSPVSFFSNNTVGVAIVDLSKASGGTLPLTLKIGGESVSLDSITVTSGSPGKGPKVSSARAQNGSSSTILRVLGSKFGKDATSIEIVPTDRVADSVNVKGKVIKAVFSSSECIPSGSFVNVSTGNGTAAKKIKTSGSCSNPLVE